MKKWMILWMIGIMCISLCACRPADGEGNCSLAGESELAPETETQQPETPEEAQPPVETEQEASGEGEGEEATTEETATETTEIPEEDSAIRAEAERIRVEEGQHEYMQFCEEHDILAYCYFTVDDDIVPGFVSVHLKKCVSERGKAAPDFSFLDPESVEEHLCCESDVPDEEYYQCFYIRLKNNKDKKAVIDAIKQLEQFDYVLCAEPSFYCYPC